MLRRCSRHGYFDGPACPDCGDDGHPILGDDRRVRLSKFVSGALRHFPADAGLSLDDSGWVQFDSLAEAVTDRYEWAEPEHVEAVLETDPKGRFERRDDQVRAAYGHSVDVALDSTDAAVPDRLYHGTAPRNLDAIFADGLEPMSRQSVHLSETPAEAREVGRRHADDPVVLVVDAESMRSDGVDIDKRGGATYTSDRVPPTYLERLDE